MTPPGFHFTVGGWLNRGKGTFPTRGAQVYTTLPMDGPWMIFPETGMCWNFDWQPFFDLLRILVE